MREPLGRNRSGNASIPIYSQGAIVVVSINRNGYIERCGYRLTGQGKLECWPKIPPTLQEGVFKGNKELTLKRLICDVMRCTNMYKEITHITDR
jgi:hypothetical protein